MAEEKITTDNKQQTTDELKILKLEMEKCKKEAEEYLNGWKRAKADYLNLKNQAGEAQKDLVRFANLGMILNFLPIYDGLKRACKEAPSTRFVEASARQAGRQAKNLRILFQKLTYLNLWKSKIKKVKIKLFIRYLASRFSFWFW